MLVSNNDKNQALESLRVGLKTQVYHLQLLEPWASCLGSLKFYFSICKMRTITLPLAHGYVRIRGENGPEVSAPMSQHFHPSRLPHMLTHSHAYASHNLNFIFLHLDEIQNLGEPFRYPGIVLITPLQQVSFFCFCDCIDKTWRLHWNPTGKVLQGHKQKLDFSPITIVNGLHVVLLIQTAYLPFPSSWLVPRPC